MPATKIAAMLLACTVALAGCDLPDKAASFLPEMFRQPSAEPPQGEAKGEGEPDVKELIRANADTLFTARPTALAVARPRRITGRGFSVCVNAVVAGALNREPQPITLIVIVERGKVADRRRAVPQDGCAGESYEKVEPAR
jgi:hypothetical protein